MTFLTKSPTLEKLQPEFQKAKDIILSAIESSRPIVIRHHADCDGYAAGVAIELALRAKISRYQSKRNLVRYVSRSPSRAPFYDIGDAIRDSMQALQSSTRFGKALPLVIILDNGSSPEDLLGIQHGKAFGLEYIVVDHHPQSEDVITREVLAHINPTFHGDTSFSAGMLAAELANMIRPDKDHVYLAALSGISDRIENTAYLQLAGKSREELGNTTRVIDFVLAKMPGDISEYVLALMQPGKEQEKIVGLFLSHVEELEHRALTMAQKAVEEEMIDGMKLSSIDIGSAFPHASYPKAGKVVGLLHDTIQEPAVTIGHTENSLILRANEAACFSLHTFLSALQKEEPDTFAEGGGHECAGTIRFFPPQKSQVIKALKKYISQCGGKRA